jgi:hypothetical protein
MPRRFSDKHITLALVVMVSLLFVVIALFGSKNEKTEIPTQAPGFHQKDQYENYAHKQVCNGQISLVEAQRRISTDLVQILEGGSWNSGDHNRSNKQHDDDSWQQPASKKE